MRLVLVKLMLTGWVASLFSDWAELPKWNGSFMRIHLHVSLHRRTFIDKTLCILWRLSHNITLAFLVGGIRFEPLTSLTEFLKSALFWTGALSIKCVLIWAVFFCSQGQKGHCGFSGLPGEPVSISQTHFDTSLGQQVEFSWFCHHLSNLASVMLLGSNESIDTVYWKYWKWREVCLLWHRAPSGTLLSLIWIIRSRSLSDNVFL